MPGRTGPKTMTMYPFLTGFWISAGASTGIMFALLYLHETRGSFSHLPHWFFTGIIALIYIAPFVGLAYVWHHFARRRHRETTRATQQRYLTGAIIGAIVIITVAYLLIPLVQH